MEKRYYSIVMSSEKYGNEIFGPYDSEHDRDEAMSRLVKSALEHQKQDGIVRSFSVEERHAGSDSLNWDIDNFDGITCQIIDVNDDGSLVCDNVTHDDAKFIVKSCVGYGKLHEALLIAREFIDSLMSMTCGNEAHDALVNNGELVLEDIDTALEETKRWESAE